MNNLFPQPQRGLGHQLTYMYIVYMLYT